jgi:hypothetical protein
MHKEKSDSVVVNNEIALLSFNSRLKAISTQPLLVSKGVLLPRPSLGSYSRSHTPSQIIPTAIAHLRNKFTELSNERTLPIQRHIACFAARPPRYRNDSRKSTGSVQPGRAGILPLKQGLCLVCPFYWQQIIKRPSHRAVVQGRPSHTLLLSLIPRPPPNRNSFLKPASSTSLPLDSLRTSRFFERLTFIQHRPRPRFRPSSLS